MKYILNATDLQPFLITMSPKKLSQVKTEIFWDFLALNISAGHGYLEIFGEEQEKDGIKENITNLWQGWSETAQNMAQEPF